MDSHHRKIDLQAPADFTYLLNNIKDAAQKKLDLHIPPSAASEDGDDAFRTKVEELVHQYINQTLTLALPSIAINGLDASPSLLHSVDSSSTAAPGDATTSSTTTTTDPADLSSIDPNDPSYTTYDPRLAERLRTLHATLEAETTRVASLRRDAPAKAAQRYAEQLQKEVEAREREVEGLRTRAREEGERRARAMQLGGKEKEAAGLVERSARIQKSWDDANRGLQAMSGVTEEVARAERAGRVVGEIERL